MHTGPNGIKTLFRVNLHNRKVPSVVKCSVLAVVSVCRPCESYNACLWLICQFSEPHRREENKNWVFLGMCFSCQYVLGVCNSPPAHPKAAVHLLINWPQTTYCTLCFECLFVRVSHEGEMRWGLQRHFLELVESGTCVDTSFSLYWEDIMIVQNFAW